MKKNKYFDLNKKELIEKLESVEDKKKYGLVWEDKIEYVAEECKTNYHYFIEDTSKKLLLDKKGPTSILIEGENFHALSILSCTHKNKIDIIYIDPPYNNGNSDWKYNNCYINDEDFNIHEKWCFNMHY